VVVTLMGIGQAPILFGNVPPAELGVWYLLFAVATFIGLSDFGLPSTFGRAVAYLRGRENSPGTARGAEIPSIYRTVDLPEMYASALVATVLSSLAFALVALPVSLLYFARALPAGPPSGSMVAPLLVFLFGVVLNLAAAIPGACLSGCGDVAWDNAIRTVASAVGFGLICALVPGRGSLGILCAIYVVQGIVALAGSHALLARRRRIGRLRDMRPNLVLVRSMYRESASFFVSRVGSWLTVESTLLIAGHFMGSGRIADFGVLRQMVAIGASVTTAIPLAISPQVAAAHSADDRERIRSLYLAALRYSLVVNVLWTLGLLLWAPTVMEVLVGKEHFLGYGVLVPLALGSFLELHAVTHGFFMWNVGRWPFAPYVVAGGILNVAFASIACDLWGFAGLAWGSLLAQAATVYWVQVAYALRQMGIAFRTYLRGTILPAMGYAAALAVAGSAIRALAEPAAHLAASGASGRLAGAAYALAGIVATTVAAAALSWALALTRDDRLYFLRLARFRR
jgi:O-antigen/teichoic acid export membrane protein